MFNSPDDILNRYISNNHYGYNYDKYTSKQLQQEISNKLTNLFRPKSRLDKVITAIIRELMDYKVVPYFVDVISRYTEAEFHDKLANGFDIVDDLRDNHPDIYGGFIKVTRKLRNRLNFDHRVLFDMIISIVESPPYNWKITNTEHVQLYNMVIKLNDEIYS